MIWKKGGLNLVEGRSQPQNRRPMKTFWGTRLEVGYYKDLQGPDLRDQILPGERWVPSRTQTGTLEQTRAFSSSTLVQTAGWRATKRQSRQTSAACSSVRVSR